MRSESYIICLFLSNHRLSRLYLVFVFDASRVATRTTCNYTFYLPAKVCKGTRYFAFVFNINLDNTYVETK